MTFFVFCCISAVLLAQLEASGKFKKGLKAGLLLLTVISAIQFNFGRDYWNYYTFFMAEIAGTNGSLKYYLSEYGSFKNEWGWVILQLIFKPLGEPGFFLMIALISIIQNLAIYQLIYRYVDKPWYGLSMFLYVISNSYFVLNLTMLRQSLAISIILFVIPLILQKKLLVPILTVLVASTIHKSSLIFLPFVFWGWLPQRGATLYASIYVFAFFIQFLIPSIPAFLSQQLAFSEEASMYFSNYSDFGAVTYSYRLGFLVTILPFIIAMYFLSKSAQEDKTINSLVLLSSISFVLMPMNTVFALSSRLGLYFSVLSIATIPITYKKIPNDFIKAMCIVIIIAVNIMGYVIHIQEPDLNNDTSSFHTIFEQLF